MANTFKVVTRASVDHSSADTIYTVPGSTTAVILGMTICNRHSSGQKIVLQTTDGITAQAAANDYIDISMSFMEIT